MDVPNATLNMFNNFIAFPNQLSPSQPYPTTLQTQSQTPFYNPPTQPLDELDDKVVRETKSPSPLQRRTWKEPAKNKTNANPKRWSPGEELLLTRACVNIFRMHINEIHNRLIIFGYALLKDFMEK